MQKQTKNSAKAAKQNAPKQGDGADRKDLTLPTSTRLDPFESALDRIKREKLAADKRPDFMKDPLRAPYKSPSVAVKSGGPARGQVSQKHFASNWFGPLGIFGDAAVKKTFIKAIPITREIYEHFEPRATVPSKTPQARKQAPKSLEPKRKYDPFDLSYVPYLKRREVRRAIGEQIPEAGMLIDLLDVYYRIDKALKGKPR